MSAVHLHLNLGIAKPFLNLPVVVNMSDPKLKPLEHTHWLSNKSGTSDSIDVAHM